MDKDFKKEKKGKKKMIALFIIILLIVGVALAKNLLPLNKNFSEKIKGVNTKIDDPDKNAGYNDFSAVKSGLKNDMEEKLRNIRQQIDNLSVSELASSSPQVQKIIKDVESLKDLPKKQAREACINMCKGL